MIQNEIDVSKIIGFNLGIKLVRGAYMNEERLLAEQNSYESPIWNSIEETHASYDANVKNIIENMTPNSRLLMGSHNVNSVNKALDLLQKHQITDHRVRFAQLKGFSDQLTG